MINNLNERFLPLTRKDNEFLNSCIENFGVSSTRDILKLDLNERIKNKEFLIAHIRNLMLNKLEEENKL